MNLEDNSDNLSKLKAEKDRIIGFLTLAIIGFVILLTMYISAVENSDQKSKIIDTCTSNINDIEGKLSTANEAITSMNSEFDSISSDASSSAGSDYEIQETTLDDISTRASDAQNNDDYIYLDNSCTQIDG